MNKPTAPILTVDSPAELAVLRAHRHALRAAFVAGATKQATNSGSYLLKDDIDATALALYPEVLP